MVLILSFRLPERERTVTVFHYFFLSFTSNNSIVSSCSSSFIATTVQRSGPFKETLHDIRCHKRQERLGTIDGRESLKFRDNGPKRWQNNIYVHVKKTKDQLNIFDQKF